MHSDKVREINANEFETEVLKSKLPVIVDFYSTECPPCEAVAPKFEGLAELFGDHVNFLKIFRQGNRELAEQLNVRSSPTLLFYNGGKEVDERLIGAIRRAAIAASLNKLVSSEIAQRIAENQRPSTTETDLLIIGGGPAGLTAGIYAAQAKLKVLVVDLALGGGNVATTHQVSNFPGFPKPQPGFMLAHYMVEHAKATGVETRLAADVSQVNLETSSLVVDGLETIRAKKSTDRYRLLAATHRGQRRNGVQGARHLVLCHL